MMTSPSFSNRLLLLQNSFAIVSSCIQNPFQKHRYFQIFSFDVCLGFGSYCCYFFFRIVNALEPKRHVTVQRLCQYNVNAAFTYLSSEDSDQYLTNFFQRETI